MRIILFYLLITASLHAQKTHRLSDLDDIKGLLYVPNTAEPFTGIGVEKHTNGRKVMEMPIKEGKINGTVKEWTPDGVLILEVNYKEGKKEGSEKGWYNTGKPKIELVNKNDVPEGRCLEWHENGQFKSEGVYQNGKENGLHVWWHDNGKKDQETNFSDGKIIGLFQSWYRNGSPRLKINYENGLKNGLSQEWYENGQIKTESYFKSGIEDKTATLWSPKGQVWGVQYFENGKIVKEENYRSGNIELKNGYMEVINKSDLGISIPITGAFVSPKTASVPTYNVEGKVIQVFMTSIDSFYTGEGKTDALVLENYRQYESRKIQKIIEKTFDTQAETVAVGSLKGLWWKFDAQQEGVKTMKKIIEEQYLSLKVGNYVLSIYSPVLDNPLAHKELLIRLANGMTLQDKPIELNSFASKLSEEAAQK